MALWLAKIHLSAAQESETEVRSVRQLSEHPRSDTRELRIEPCLPHRKCRCADNSAPVSSSNPERKAQNIKLTDKAKGP
jgi:hypothetical protein